MPPVRDEMVERARAILAEAYEKRGWPHTADRIRRGENTGEADSAPMLAVIAALTASQVEAGEVEDDEMVIRVEAWLAANPAAPYSEIKATLSDCAEFLADIDGRLAARCEDALAALAQSHGKEQP